MTIDRSIGFCKPIDRSVGFCKRFFDTVLYHIFNVSVSLDYGLKIIEDLTGQH